MKIAPYYQQLLLQAKKLIESDYPVSFIGMFDSGIDYLFGLINALKLQQGKKLIIPIDLTETNGDLKKILQALKNSFLLYTEKPRFKSLNDVLSDLVKLTNEKNVIFLFYLGYKQKLNPTFLSEFIRWRFILSTKLNWIICATYGNLNQDKTSDLIFEKFMTTNIIPVLPHSPLSAQVVLDNFIDRYGEIDTKYRQKLIKLSGGNPGILKGLFLLVQQNKIENLLADKNLTVRLNKILSELDKKELSALLKLTNSELKNVDVDRLKKLETYGYIKNGKIFSSILKTYLPYFYDESGTNLSSTQKQIFTLLKNNSPSVITRDQIAQIMWKKRWLEKYSDWALDQMIYALRNNLSKNKSRWTLKTKRNYGYYLLPK